MYPTPQWVTAFSTGKDCGVEDVGLHLDDLALPRQTHSCHIAEVKQAGRPADTDAVFTTHTGLCVCVKTADCIPVLLYDDHDRCVAAVHAGWRGTVAGIAAHTVGLMPGHPAHVHAIIGPGISLRGFEVGDEVYEAFRLAGFPMQRIARRYPCTQGGERWHLDLWEANRWQLLEVGVQDILVQGICTLSSPLYYSARRETIDTGRNMNGIFINP